MLNVQTSSNVVVNGATLDPTQVYVIAQVPPGNTTSLLVAALQDLPLLEDMVKATSVMQKFMDALQIAASLGAK